MSIVGIARFCGERLGRARKYTGDVRSLVVAIALTGCAVIGFLSQSWPPQSVTQGRPAQSATAETTPRLPRPRPDEPMTTGSIRTADAVVAAEPGPSLRNLIDRLGRQEGQVPSVAAVALSLPTADEPSVWSAIGVCEAKVKAGLPIPTAFQRLFSTTGVIGAPGGDTLVAFDYRARNGLGFPVAGHADCVVHAGRVARLQISER